MVKKILLTAALFAAVCTALAAGYSVKCQVASPDYKDVVICDGEKFYPVSADGRCEFSFERETDAFIYILTPSDLKVAGSYTVPLKPGANTVNFKLEKQTVPEKFRFILGTDIQYDFMNEKLQQQLFNDMQEIQQVADSHKCEFIAFPGDMTETGEVPVLSVLKRALDSTPLRKYNVWGGHDGYKSKTGKIKNFSDVMGAPYFSWNFGGIHFFAPLSEFHLLNEIERERMFTWIRNDLDRLAPGTPVFVVTHIPMYLSRELRDMMNERKLRLIGYAGAHYHYSNLHYFEGIPFIYNGTLRWTDDGTFTKKIRLVECSAKDGVIKTETRFLNNSRRIHAALAGNHLTVFVYDTALDPQSVTAVIDGKEVALTRQGEFIWDATLAAPLSAKKISVTAKAANDSWSKDVTVSAPANLKWSYATGSNFQRFPAPVIHGDRLYIGLSAADKSNGSGGVLVLDRNTGKKIYQVLDGIDFSGGVVTDGKLLFALSNDGDLYTLNAVDGTVVRQQKLTSKQVYFGMWQHASSPMQLVDGKLLAIYQHNYGTWLFCIDTATGNPVWEKPYYFGISEKAGSFHAQDGVIYYCGRYHFGALELATGKLLWKKEHKSIAYSSVRPLVVGNAVYFYMRASAWKVDRKTGNIIWSNTSMPGSVNKIGGLLPLDNGKVVAFSTNTIVMLNDADGKRLSRVNINPLHPREGLKYQFLISTSVPLLVNKQAIISVDDGAVYRVDPETGRPEKLLETGSAFKGFPVSAGNMYYTVAFDGNIYAMEIK